ncbi:hypothetical protein NIBR502770_17325 [Pseudarthrobacter sp. NIBRBAC000502770]|nr:hypothetical protein NIBR502770_17325 [Pseudarthrobacter sp. NIBRBAC000502770]
MLVSYTEVSPRKPAMGVTIPDARTDLTRSTLDGTTAPPGHTAVHCGTPMQLVTPALGWQRASYTFAPTAPGDSELPPVWRCACGFQLDACSAGPRVARRSADLSA